MTSRHYKSQGNKSGSRELCPSSPEDLQTGKLARHDLVGTASEQLLLKMILPPSHAVVTGPTFFIVSDILDNFTWESCLHLDSSPFFLEN